MKSIVTFGIGAAMLAISYSAMAGACFIIAGKMYCI